MTAHDQMRAMLDQLMGTGRNGNSIRPSMIALVNTLTYFF